MKKYIRATSTSALIGIWWIKDDTVIADYRTADTAYNDGSFLNYDYKKNHETEWRRLVKEYFPEEAEEIISKGYRSLDRGRVLYNLRTQCYEVTCGPEVYNDPEARKLLVDAFELEGCRYDFINLGQHYHRAPLTGNHALDEFEYGL